MEEEKLPSTMGSNKESKFLRSGFSLLNEDLLAAILSKLPAADFAAAASVNTAWRRACDRVLARPKLASALSRCPSLEVALQEVLDKVLSEPIRPHFVIANVVGGFKLGKTFEAIVEKFGTHTPIVVSRSSGIIGRDAVTNEFKEVMLADSDDEDHLPTNYGIVLTVGYVPGLKVDAIPLLQPKKVAGDEMIDKFVMDIRNYTASVSGCESPLGIIMFGNEDVDQKPLLEKLDYAMGRETVIVGDERCQCLYQSTDESRNVDRRLKQLPDAVALVFARDRENCCGIIQFHPALSSGISAIGPRYKAASVKLRNLNSTTWLTARREGQQQTLDGQQLLADINVEMDSSFGNTQFYIGVTERRSCAVGSEKPSLMTSLAFHGVEEGDEEYLYVTGGGIKTGDLFQFYRADPVKARIAVDDVTTYIEKLKLGWDSNSCADTNEAANSIAKKEAFGGFIFSCCGRGEFFFGKPNVDSLPLLKNFPGIPLGGVFCCGEIGRSCSIPDAPGVQEENSSLHVYSSIYLIMSYSPALAPTEH